MPRTAQFTNVGHVPGGTDAIGFSDLTAATECKGPFLPSTPDFTNSAVTAETVAGFDTASRTETTAGWNSMATASELWKYYARRMKPPPEIENNINTTTSQGGTTYKTALFGPLAGNNGTATGGHEKAFSSATPEAIKMSQFRDHWIMGSYERIKPFSIVGGYMKTKNGSYALRVFSPGASQTITMDRISKTSIGGALMTWDVGPTQHPYDLSTDEVGTRLDPTTEGFYWTYYPQRWDVTHPNGQVVTSDNRVVQASTNKNDWIGTTNTERWSTGLPGTLASTGWGDWLQNHGVVQQESFVKYSNNFADFIGGSWGWRGDRSDIPGTRRQSNPGTRYYHDIVDFGVDLPNTWAIRAGGDDTLTIELPWIDKTFTAAGYTATLPGAQTFSLPVSAGRYQQIECKLVNGGTARNPSGFAAVIYNTSVAEQTDALSVINDNMMFGDKRDKFTWYSRQNGNFVNGFAIHTYKGSRSGLQNQTPEYSDPLIQWYGHGGHWNWNNWDTSDTHVEFTYFEQKTGYDIWTGKTHSSNASGVIRTRDY